MDFKDWMKTIVVVFFLCLIILPLTFKNEEIVLDVEGTAIIVKSSWWGFKKEEIEIKSMNNKWFYLDKRTYKWNELMIADGTMNE